MITEIKEVIEYIDEMIMYAEKVIRHTKDLDLENYKEKDIVSYGSFWCIMKMAAAAYKLPLEIYDLFGSKQKYFMRIIAAGYALETDKFETNISVFFSITQDTIPKLLPKIKEIKSMLSEAEKNKNIKPTFDDFHYKWVNSDE